tara:strand:+ start:964 stop:1170 length:207 start_codon:yes stop_codon:yes gene_type:complete
MNKRQQRRVIKYKNLTDRIISNIWNDITNGFVQKEIQERNNVTSHTIDKLVKNRMRINRFDELKEKDI